MPPSSQAPPSGARSSNLRIKKAFSDREKDGFLEESFEYIANYFEGSLKELESRNKGIEGSFRRVDADHFSAAAYRDGELAASCRIWRAGRASLAGSHAPRGRVGARIVTTSRYRLPKTGTGSSSKLWGWPFDRGGKMSSSPRKAAPSIFGRCSSSRSSDDTSLSVRNDALGQPLATVATFASRWRLLGSFRTPLRTALRPLYALGDKDFR
jgi:hypothetical protein